MFNLPQKNILQHYTHYQVCVRHTEINTRGTFKGMPYDDITNMINARREQLGDNTPNVIHDFTEYHEALECYGNIARDLYAERYHRGEIEYQNLTEVWIDGYKYNSDFDEFELIERMKYAHAEVI